MTFSLPKGDPLLTLAVVLVAGVAFGSLAKRVRLPSVTGQILAGVLLGPAVLGVIDTPAVASLHAITHFALALMAVTIGAHLNLRKLRNAGKRLFVLAALEALLTPALVFGALYVLAGLRWSTALLFGTLAISTAPATIVALVRETRSRGVFVKTLVAAVALDNIACILAFELARVAGHADLGVAGLTAAKVLAAPGVQLAKAAMLGTAATIVMEIFARVYPRRDRLASAAVVTLLLVSGLATAIDASPLLSALFFGMIQANVTRERDKLVDAMFSDFLPAIFAGFFTLAGMELTFAHLEEVGLVALLFFVARALGKVLSARWAMQIAGATAKLRDSLGMALLPQAGVAIGLVVLLEEDPAYAIGRGHDTLALFVGAVLTVVTISEIVGPILTRVALVRAGEAGKDRLRLIDFIQEENIKTGLRAETKEGAIRQLMDLLVRTHQLEPSLREPLLRSVLEREAEISTCLGGGLAVPHGILPVGSKMVGVMGLSPHGLDFETPDGRPVHCMVLLATPDNERERHLQVLASLAATVGMNTTLQLQLYNAKSAAHAYELLQDDKESGVNRFLDDETR
jgi:PTS system fructose-specific IIC component